MAVQYKLNFERLKVLSENNVKEAYFSLCLNGDTNLSSVVNAITKEMGSYPKDTWRFDLSNDSARLMVVITDGTVAEAVAKKYECVSSYNYTVADSKSPLITALNLNQAKVKSCIAPFKSYIRSLLPYLEC